MFTKLPKAVENIGAERRAARTDLALGTRVFPDRFFAMMPRYGVRPLRPDPDASLSKLIFDRAATIARGARKTLKLTGEHGMTICDGLRISELVNGLLELEQIAFA